MTNPPPPAPRPRHKSRRSDALGIAPPTRFWSENYLLVGLFAAVVLLLSSEVEWLPPGPRAFLLPATLALVASLIALCRDLGDDVRIAVRRGPNPLIVLLLLWCVVSAGMAPFRAHAVADLTRVLLGACVYFLAAYALRPSQVWLMVWSVLGVGVGVSLVDFVRFGATVGGLRALPESVFGNHENIGSFLTLLLPIVLALATSNNTPEKPRLAAQAMFLVLGCALLLARARASWVGSGIGLITLTLLAARHAPLPRLSKRNKHLLVSPLLALTLGFVVLVVLGQVGPLVSKRFATFASVGDDSSFSDRLGRWESAARMTAERPLTGWGMGAWPVIQGRWTHQGDDAPAVLARGTGHQNIAHNYWVQWAAENGAPGLILHVSVVAAFVLGAIGALGSVTSPFRRLLLLGLIAAVVGGCVDAAGSPSYNYPGVSTLLWLWMGLGVAAGREERAPPPAALPPTSPAFWGVALAPGVLVTAVVIGAGYKQLLIDGPAQPRGLLRVTTRPLPPDGLNARPSVLWTAVYTDGNGKRLSTAPGTEWTVSGARPVGADGSLRIISLNTGLTRQLDLAGWRGQVVAPGARATATAVYWDRYGRRYEASAITGVKGER